MADDPLIEKSEQVDAERAAKAARLFDIRRLIGGLFLIYGVILTVLGLGESDASIAKSADINVNLYAGVGMLIMAAGRQDKVGCRDEVEIFWAPPTRRRR